MSKLAWDESGKHLYKTGVSHGVIYDVDNSGNYVNGEAWNGLTSFTKSPSGAEETKLYADNIKYLSLRSAEDFGATIGCYTYPKLFEVKNGSVSPDGIPGMKIYQQARKTFGLAVQTIIGNDTETNDYGFELHLCYGMSASPSEEAYNTVNESPEAIEFSYTLSSIPVAVKGYKPTAVVTLDSTAFLDESGVPYEGKKYKQEFINLLNVLYGTDSSTADLPTAVSNPTGNPKTKGYYEKTGSATPDVMANYTLTTDETVDNQKTYYELVTTPGTTARLPLPDEIIEILGGTTAG